MSENAHENEGLSCMHAFKCLKNSKMDMRTLTMIHQLNKIVTAATAHELVSKQLSNDLQIDGGSTAH
jgi:hypothetical protein